MFVATIFGAKIFLDVVKTSDNRSMGETTLHACVCVCPWKASTVGKCQSVLTVRDSHRKKNN